MRRILILLAVLLCAAAVQADTFTYGRGADEATDFSVRGGADSLTNFWDQTLLRTQINAAADSTRIYQTSVVYFDCVTDISGATIDSAILTLYSATFDGDPGSDSSFTVRRMLVAWTQTQTNARYRQTAVTWNAMHALGAGTDYTATGAVTKELTGTSVDMTFDVTTIVQAWASGSSNYGFGLYGTGNVPARIDFISADNATTAQRPYLRIYTAAGAAPSVQTWFGTWYGRLGQ